ncbi:MAG: hypothetical protein IJ540_09305 [Prevotella sp.]|nr:hypothetical protein [Prevotella sp.]
MKIILVTIIYLFVSLTMSAQGIPTLETGGQAMPDEWIDKDTGFRVFKLTRRPGTNHSFYFHNQPFVGQEMLFLGSDASFAGNDNLYGAGREYRQQLYAVNLQTLAIRQLTQETQGVRSEVVCPQTHEYFFQQGDSVFALNIDNRQKRLITVMKEGLRGNFETVNADGTLLAGKLDCPEEARILKEHPQKGEFFRLIFESKAQRTIFTIDTRTGMVDTVYSENEWTNHMQFSPTDPHLLMFCHEGPWHEVDRIWTIDVVKRGQPRLIHKRTIHREIAGHEWWGADGQHIYFDLQKPRGETFFVGKTDVYTGKEVDYELQRDEWSVHYVTSWDLTFMAGDGGASNSVARSPNGHWIYRFDIDNQRLKSTKLVNLKNHQYKLEPNIHFSPDDRYIIFRANFEGAENVYAVDLKRD